MKALKIMIVAILFISISSCEAIRVTCPTYGSTRVGKHDTKAYTKYVRRVKHI